MTKFQSKRVLVNASEQEVYHFLSDFRNFKDLMPPQIVDWQADEDSCSFTIQGMASLSMRMQEKVPFQKIHIKADGQNPIDYSLDCYFEPEEENRSRVEIVFDAELNPFLKMVASGPLQNLVNMLADKLEDIFAKRSE
ncbi:MAG: SRPBCC family protein [Bacteroides sp.]|jgi:carbon monoxide dehydrogenase subunit G|nr:SRPBCC family protein [Bacteroides sp.]